ncbi:hypothetical protein CU098_013899, partial [Rhizopus stolonifer]
MELPQVGKNCNLENCNSLDFLPVTCPFCQKTFCGDHRLPLNHQCSQWKQMELLQCEKCLLLIKASENLSTEETVEAKAFDRKCSVKDCHDVDSRIGSILCEGCDGGYCLKHRHPSTHQCESLFADEKKRLERKLAAQEKVAKTLK